MFVAGRPQKIHRDGKVVELEPGDPFPEAEGYGHLRSLVNQGFVVWETEEKPANKHDAKTMQDAVIGGVEMKRRKAKPAPQAQG